MESFLQGIAAYKITRDIQRPVPLDSDIRVLDASFHQFNVHFLLPQWKAGHSGRTPQSKKPQEEGSPPDERSISRQDTTSTSWTLDLGATLGRSGNQIIRVHKMTPYPTAFVPPQWLRVTMVDHCLNPHTPWAIGVQPLILKYRILGHPNSKAIDLQIPTHHRQTCMDAILLAVRNVGCQEERLPKLSAGTQVFTSNRAHMQGPCCPRAIHSNPKDHMKLPHHTSLADVMAMDKRVTMFLPRESRNGTTWGATCLAKDTEIRLADGPFALIPNSAEKSIWTDQQEERRITRIHKFETEKADLRLFGIGGN